MYRSLLSAVLSLNVLLSPLVAAQDASYTFTTIDVPGSTSTVTTGINDRRQIVGRFRDAAGGPHGLLIDGTTLTIIDVPGITETTEANGINNSGQIVGIFRDATGALHSFLKDGTTITTFDVPDATFTYATGINDRGQIVGFFDDATGTHGFLTTDGVTFTIIDVPDSQWTQAFGINDSSEIVGYFLDATGIHGFLKDGSTFTTIDVPGAQSTQPRGINAVGQIVGTFDTIGGSHSFLTDGTTFTTFDVPSATRFTWAYGINAMGQIVGAFGDNMGVLGVHGFVATPVDTTPPAITVAASPATLSPPNGKLVTVTVSGTIKDELGGSGVQVSSAAYTVMDEYGQIQPSGPFTPDEADGSYAFTVDLQASRQGNDRDGRHYTIEVCATDHADNLGGASATVTVPRN